MSTETFGSFLQEGVWRQEWPALADDEAGDPASLSRWPTKAFQATGTFGASGAVAIQGSNDGINWFALDDSLGTVISLTSSAPIADVLQNTAFIRPVVTAGDESTDIRIIGVCV